MKLLQQLNSIDQYLDTRRFQESEDVLLASGGGVAGGLGFAGGGHVQWNQGAGWSTNSDNDYDGIPDSQDSCYNDKDGDHIPDAIDAYYGPGAD
jgi:hypothetical protein